MEREKGEYKVIRREKDEGWRWGMGKGGSGLEETEKRRK